MKTQQDHNIRILALVNLEAICSRVSSTCHRFWIEKVSRSRVHVGYSNPGEYGNENPMYAVFPCFPSSRKDDEKNPRVVLEIMRIISDSWDGEGWQAFSPVMDHESLFRSPYTTWETRYEILVAKNPAYRVTSRWKDSCTQVFDCAGLTFTSWEKAKTFALANMEG